MELLSSLVGWGLAIVFVVLVVAFLFFTARSERILRDRFRRVTLDPQLGDFIVPLPSMEHAIGRANERINNIRSFFARNEVPLTGEVPPTLRSMILDEYLELLPGTDGPLSRRFEQGAEAAGQMARLVWQVQKPEFALGERVVDVIASLHRRLDREREPPTVRLVPLEPASRGGLFPWVAVIETDSPELYRQQLLQLSEWLGIAVSVAPRRRVIPFSGCRVGGGRAGVIGGGVATSSDTYLITCAHVLSQACRSLVLRQHPAGGGSEPDAALLSAATPCFDRPSEPRQCRVAPSAEIDQLIGNTERTVVKRHPQCNGREGFIRNRAHAFSVEGVLHRFPHVEILPVIGQYGVVSTPLWGKAFSKPGDSGCWVRAKQSDSWIGMVVGGDEYFLATFALEAEPFFHQLALLLSDRGESMRFAFSY